MFYSYHAKSRQDGKALNTDSLLIVTIIKSAAAFQTGGHDRNKCIVLLKLINIIVFITSPDWIKST